jgi:hypothetical protein
MYQNTVMDLVAWHAQIATVVSQNGLVSYAFPFATRVKSLVELSLSAERLHTY